MITLKFIQDLFYGRDPLSREEIILAEHFMKCEKKESEKPEEFAFSRVESILILEANKHRSSVTITPEQILGSEQDHFFSNCKNYILVKLDEIGLLAKESADINGIYVSWQ